MRARVHGKCDGERRRSEFDVIAPYAHAVRRVGSERNGEARNALLKGLGMLVRERGPFVTGRKHIDEAVVMLPRSADLADALFAIGEVEQRARSGVQSQAFGKFEARARGVAACGGLSSPARNGVTR